MGFALDDNGRIMVDSSTGLAKQVYDFDLLEQDARSECRCEQQGWFADSDYGRNPLVWKLPTGQSDKIADIKRIVTKYYQPTTISPTDDGLFQVT